MSFLEAIGCQTKSPQPDVGYLPSPHVIVQKCPRDPQTVQTLLLIFHQNVMVRSYCGRHHTLVTGYGEIKSELNKKLPLAD